MCGIAGFVGPGDHRDLAAMMHALVHRGPDGEGRHCDPGRSLFLGHRRLAVVDIQSGAQPMWNLQHTVAVIFNGEIYNHHELRRALEALGYVFQSHHSDTEVLVHGYSAWGEDLPRRLNGMFAFCIYDVMRQRLFLARDRFGEKPLYFVRQGSLFAFASELTAFSAHSGFTGRLSITALQKFFAYGFIPAPHAILENCEKLPGGCSLTFDLRTKVLRKARYWQFLLAPDEAMLHRPETELAEELRHLVVEAVKRRLVADVPLGFFLSGGLDSSAIVAVAARLAPAHRIETFTLGFSEPSFDESAHAAAVAGALGVSHACQTLDLNRARDQMMGVLARLDEPSGDPSILPTALLAKFARKRVTVALSGDGADELFAGYHPFKALAPAEVYKALVPRPLHELLRQAAARLPLSDQNMSLDFKLRRALTGLSYPSNLWNPVWLAPLDPALQREVFERPITPEALYSEALDLWSAGSSPAAVDKTLEFYTNFYLQDGILNKLDRAAMMSSLEARSPFLDNDLVEFCRRLPHQLKMRGGQRKYLLKKAMAGVVPAVVLRQAKKGFGMPTSKWLRTVPPMPPLEPVAGVRLDSVQRAWGQHRRREADHRLFLWGWLSVQQVVPRLTAPKRAAQSVDVEAEKPRVSLVADPA